jgi:hypothetical protein
VITVDIRCDLNDEDETGMPWAFVDEASDASIIYPGAIVVAPKAPQRRHHRSASTTRHAKSTRSTSTRSPVATNPSSSRRQNTVRSGLAKLPSDKVGVPHEVV